MGTPESSDDMFMGDMTTMPGTSTLLSYTIAGSGLCADNVYYISINFNDCSACPIITSPISVDNPELCEGSMVSACVNYESNGDADMLINFDFGGTIIPAILTPDPGPPSSTWDIIRNPFAPYTIPAGPFYVGDIINLPGTASHPLSFTMSPPGAMPVAGATTTIAYTVTEAGTYSIECDIHASMTGTFDVLPAPVITTGTACATYTTADIVCFETLNINAAFLASSIDTGCSVDPAIPIVINIYEPITVGILDMGTIAGGCGPFMATGGGCAAGDPDGDGAWIYEVDINDDGIIDEMGSGNNYTPLPGTGGSLTFMYLDPDYPALCASGSASASFICTILPTIMITDSCVCQPGGMFDDLISITGGTEPYTVTSVSGASIAGVPIAIGDVLSPMTTIQHMSDIGYTLTITDTIGNEVSISGMCMYPTLDISGPLGSIACNSSTDLTANVTGTIITYDWSNGGTGAMTNTGILTTTTDFDLTITDDQGCIVSDMITVIVDACPVIIDAVDDVGYTVDNDASITGNVLLNDTYPVGTTVTFGIPSSGTLSTSPDGSFTFTPDAGFIGTVTFSYTINDGAGGIDVANVTIVVTNSTAVSILNTNIETDCKRVHISWTTATESNSSHFTIERSSDGINYVLINEIAASGTSSIAHFYNCYDPIAINGTYYYRITQLDIYGNKQSLPLLAIDGSCTSSNTTISNLFPNPTNSLINYEVTSQINEELAVKVLDVLGRELYTSIISVNLGTNIFTFDAAGIANGVYFITLSKENGIMLANQKFVKTR